jgi:hypothetical protein
VTLPPPPASARPRCAARWRTLTSRGYAHASFWGRAQAGGRVAGPRGARGARDVEREPDETLTVRYFDVANASIPAAHVHVTGTIVDDD